MADQVDKTTGEINEIPQLPFAAWLQDLRGGRAHAELTEGLGRLVAAVRQYHKKGELKFTVKVNPADSAGEQVTVVYEVTVTEPQASLPVSFFFVDQNNNLVRDDPTRVQLDLREVPAPDTTKLREAGE